MELSIEGLQAAISKKPAGFNSWILKVYNRETEKRTLKQFYTELLFTVANF